MSVFVRVAECASFSRAAESLDLANATVTTCVRNLESHLGVTLIHRDTRRLHLTEEGELFLERARAILRAVEDAETEVQARRGELRGKLHIEMPISIGRALVGPALPAFAARYPGLTTAITLSNEPNHVIASGIDVAIRMDRVEDGGLVARPIYETAFMVCTTPATVAKLPAHPGALAPSWCLGIQPEDRPTPNPWHLSRGKESLVIVPAGPLHFNSTDALLQAVCDSGGVACVLDVFTPKLIADGALVPVYTEWQTETKTFYAVTAKHRATAAKVRAFTDFLGEVLDAQKRPKSPRKVEVRAIAKR
mgnify:CR=1 FL=1